MTQCANCETEKTPMWRKTVDTSTNTVLTLCNACGIYYKTKGSHRPRLLISKKNILSLSELFDKLQSEEADKLSNEQQKEELENKPKVLVKNDIKLEDLNIIRCSNCENINTSIWRRDGNGKSICNACGLFYKKKGYHRTVKKSNEDMFLSIDENLIRFNKIKRRNRSTSSSSPSANEPTAPVSRKRKRSSSVRSVSSESSSQNSSPITKTVQVEDQKLDTYDKSNNVTEISVSPNPTGSQSPGLIKYDLVNYKYDTFKPSYSISDISDYHYGALPRMVRTSPPTSIKLPPISTILNFHK